MALRIGLLRSSALQNDGLDVPLILQCRTPQETNPKSHWGSNYFLLLFDQILVLVLVVVTSWLLKGSLPGQMFRWNPMMGTAGGRPKTKSAEWLTGASCPKGPDRSRHDIGSKVHRCVVRW